jgi:hypothetical protein
MPSSSLDSSLHNPYASPQPCADSRPAPAEAAKPAPGSLFAILGGFALLLVGYFTSNLLVISDLYHIGFGPDGDIPSPLAAFFKTPGQQWAMYCLSAAATIAGCILFGSQRYNPLAIVCYIMCPLACLVFLIASPLRLAKKLALPVATVYLIVGGCLSGIGMMRLFSLYGQPESDFAPVLASMATQVGLALAIGAILKLLQADAAAKSEIGAAPLAAQAR